MEILTKIIYRCVFFSVLFICSSCFLSGEVKLDNLTDPFNWKSILLRLLLNPTTNISSQGTGSHNSATLLATGKVLIAGGYGETEAYFYNPSDDSIAFVTNMLKSHSSHKATLLLNGGVLISGGFEGAGGFETTTSLSDAEVFNPSQNEFTSTNSMTTPRHDHTATFLSSGKVLIIGGHQASSGT